MRVLEVDGIHFSYDRKDVLRNVSMQADKNEIVSILGPNGVGKTTLLRCICNMLAPSEGSIRICGQDLSGVGPRDLAKLLGYVPQKASVSRTTVFDSVLIGRRPRMGITYSDHDLEVAWDVMTSLGLGEMTLDYVDEISGGEFQKVQIARALAQEPELLVLDEPSNNLDIANQHITMKMIERVVRNRGLCTVMTMHDINLAAYYSDKFVFMKDGQIAAFGGREVITPEVIREVYGMDVDVIEHNGQIAVIPNRDQPVLDRISGNRGGE